MKITKFSYVIYGLYTLSCSALLADTFYVTNAETHTVLYGNTSNGTIRGRVHGVFPNPLKIITAPTGDEAYVINSGSQEISIINTAAHRMTRTIQLTDALANNFALTPDGSKAYLSMLASGNLVQLVNVATSNATEAVADPDGVLGWPIAIAITPDGSKVYVSNDDDTITVIDVALNRAIRRIGEDDTFAEPRSVVFTPDGQKAYVVNTQSNTVSIIDVDADIVLGTVADPDGTLSAPVQVAMTPDGRKAYVVNSDDNTVSVIDVATDSIIGTVTDPDQTFADPSSIAITRDGRQAYVVNDDNNTISIIDISPDITGPMDRVRGIVINATPHPLDDPYAVAFAPNQTILEGHITHKVPTPKSHMPSAAVKQPRSEDAHEDLEQILHTYASEAWREIASAA